MITTGLVLRRQVVALPDRIHHLKVAGVDVDLDEEIEAPRAIFAKVKNQLFPADKKRGRPNPALACLRIEIDT